MAELIKNVEHASIFTLKDLVEIEPGRVNSLTLSQTPGCKMTVFAIDADEGMSKPRGVGRRAHHSARGHGRNHR